MGLLSVASLHFRFYFFLSDLSYSFMKPSFSFSLSASFHWSSSISSCIISCTCTWIVAGAFLLLFPCLCSYLSNLTMPNCLQSSICSRHSSLFHILSVSFCPWYFFLSEVRHFISSLALNSALSFQVLL